MDITPLIPKGKLILTGYGPGMFKVSGEVYNTSIFIFPDRVMPWNVSPTAAISLQSLQPVIDAASEVELLLIGGRKAQLALPQNIRNALKSAGIALDIMDTGAACRTYNILLAEGRKIAAALVVL